MYRRFPKKSVVSMGLGCALLAACCIPPYAYGATLYVNPAGNATAQSFLRLTNNNAAACLVEIEGKDDAGKYSRNPVKLTIPAHASATVNSDDLENGNAGKGITGGFTDGSGKWYVRVNAQCSNFKASALNRNSQTGTVTDLTPEKTQGLVEWSVIKANKL